jgi:hypothetical protein
MHIGRIQTSQKCAARFVRRKREPVFYDVLVYTCTKENNNALKNTYIGGAIRIFNDWIRYNMRPFSVFRYRRIVLSIIGPSD